MKRLTKTDKFILLIGVLITFSVSFYCACHLHLKQAPDEAMRYQLCEYLFKYRKLPFGDEKELLSIWGFSYAYKPYLIHILSAFLMSLVNLFSKAEASLLIAARIPSVISYSLTFVFLYLIGNELFEKYHQKLFLALSVCSIPQVIFLSAYINFDIVILAECCAIVLIWIRAYKYGWSVKRCIDLGIIVGITMLTYYNAYVYILLSAVVYIYCTLAKEKADKKTFWKNAGIAVGVALLICGGWFIRNAIIYHGDVFGLKMQDLAQEMYAIDSLKPDVIYNGPNSGLSFYTYFCNTSVFDRTNWFFISLKSLIGIFGYMTYPISTKMFLGYFGTILIGNVLFLIYLLWLYKDSPKNKVMMLAVIVTSIVMTFGLSMYYSWSHDYQAQGRYIITTLIPVFTCVSVGMCHVSDRIAEKIKLKWLSTALQIAFIVIYTFIGAKAIVGYLIPNCFTDLPL